MRLLVPPRVGHGLLGFDVKVTCPGLGVGEISLYGSLGLTPDAKCREYSWAGGGQVE